MKIPFVNLKAQYKSIKNEIDKAIMDVIDDSAFIKGKYVNNFEEEFSNAYGIKHVVGCGNGTDAIYISLKAMGINEGDEVITTAHSWISTSETISQTGAKPIFVDIEPDHYNIDTEKIKEKINERTKAIIPVHIYGHPCNMKKIMDIASIYNLRVIEDCAQAHFAQWNNKNVGTFGDVGTFSFFPGKNLGAYGDAGCIITDNDDLAEKCRMFSNHGSLAKHNHKFEGINSRLDGIQAAILSVKLKYISKWTDLRISNAEYYSSNLASKSDIKIPIVHKNAKHVFHLYVIAVENRNEVKKNLENNSISTGIHYPVPLPLLEAYKYLKHKPQEFPNINHLQSRILSLPLFPELTELQIDYILSKIN